MALGSDLNFYGSLFGLGGGSSSFLQPWQTGGGTSPYLGYSSFIPSTAIPGTAAGFLQQYIPELAGVSNLTGQITPEVEQAFQSFRFGGNAYTPGAAQEFTDTLLQRSDIQQLLKKQQLGSESAFQSGVVGATSLADLVHGALTGDQASQIKNIYGGLGFSEEQITQDLQRFAQGEASGLGDLSAIHLFGNRPGARAEHNDYSRASVLSQVLGAQGLVDIGGGTAFNPYAPEVLADEYRFNIGAPISGRDVQDVGVGILSSQDTGINATIAGALSRAAQESNVPTPYGGKGGYGLEAGFNMLANVLGEGQTLQTKGTNLAGWIDTYHAGLAGSGFGRGLGDYLNALIASQGL